jgi:hypothetical protein
LSPETSEVELARLQSRATLVELMFARFTAASGTEIPTDRRIALIEMLNAHGFTYSQFQAAEVWILKGAPCRFGKITYADFYPTHEQLESVGYDIAGIERRAREAGYRMGYDAGVAQTTEIWREEVRKMRAKLPAHEGHP